MDLFDLFAKISLDTSEYEQKADSVVSKGKNLGESIMTAFGTAGKVATAAIGALETGTVAFTGALIKGTGEVAEYGDHIDKMSQKMGMSAQAYQEWDAIMQHSGTSIDAMARGMTTLSRAAENNSDAFSRLGISQKDIQSLNQEELFAKTIESLQNMEAGTERTALAQELLGGSAKELGALLNTSAEETEEMRKRVHELGGVMSDEAVKAAAAYQDSLQDLRTSMSGLKRNIMGEFMPSLTTVMDGLTNIFSGNDNEGLGQVSKGISQFAKKITETMPRVLKVGSQIISSLASAIIENLPELISAGAQTLIEFARGIADNIDLIIDSAFEILNIIIETLTGPDGISSLIDAAFQIIEKLATALIENLPEIIPAVVEIMLQIVESLIENIDLLVDAAIQIIIALAEGLINAIPVLLEKAPEIIRKLVEAIIENVPKLLTAAWEIIQMLAQGIVDNLTTMVDKGKEMVTKITDGIKQKFLSLVTKGKEIIDEVKNGVKQKIEDAKQWGKDLIKNFISGITAKWESLKQTVRNVAKSVKSFLGFSEPEEGPLSDFHTYAPDMMDLFIKGIRDNEGKLRNQLAKTFDVEPYFKPDYSLGTTAGSSTRDSSQIVAVLSTMFPEMIQAIKDMRLYLDGDTLVGGIVDPMDEGLGRKSIYRARAN